MNCKHITVLCWLVGWQQSAHCEAEGVGEADGDGVADLAFLGFVVAAELVAGGECLEQGGFAEADGAVLGGVQEAAA